MEMWVYLEISWPLKAINIIYHVFNSIGGEKCQLCPLRTPPSMETHIQSFGQQSSSQVELHASQPERQSGKVRGGAIPAKFARLVLAGCFLTSDDDI